MKNPKFWFVISFICAGIFIVKTPLDYLVYSNTLNSAPFWVTILVNAIYFLLPSLLALIVGWIIKKK